MICFHFTIFVVLETTPWRLSPRLSWLWFAFILLSLSYWKQPPLRSDRRERSCDLLSFYYLCRTGNNNVKSACCIRGVVICFHFTIFVVLETTIALPPCSTSRCDLLSFYYLCRTGNNGLTNCKPWSWLWFAFILLSLSYWKQHIDAPDVPASGCDLLSFYYLCRTGNNGEVERRIRPPLWFAFILLSLSYWKQHCIPRNFVATCCDLLSFYYLCRTGNNLNNFINSIFCVVICFHFTIFVVLETTYLVQTCS